MHYIGTPVKNAFKLYAFKDNIVPPDEDDIDIFEKWFQDDYRPHHMYTSL